MSEEHRVSLRARTPFAGRELLLFLALRAVPGVEEGDGTRYRRTLRLPGGPAVIDVSAPDGEEGIVECRVRTDWCADERDVPHAVAAVRRLVDADADPVPIAARLGADRLVGPLVARTPGLRSPGHVDGHELAFRAVLGQQVSVRAARTIAGRLVARYGVALEHPSGRLTHLFPTAHALAGADPADLPMPAARGRALVGLAAALAAGKAVLEPGADVPEATARLQALPGIGPWTASYIAMRALGDPDAFLPTDAGVRHALTRLGRPSDPAAAARLARRWAPYRSYALHHLWAFCGDGYRLLGARGAPCLSPTPGTLGGHRRA